MISIRTNVKNIAETSMALGQVQNILNRFLGAAAALYNTGGGTQATSGWTPFPACTTEIMTSSTVVASATAGTITVKEDGWYLVYASVKGNLPGAAAGSLGIAVDGTNTDDMTGTTAQFPASSANITVTVLGILELVAGNVLEPVLNISGDATLTYLHANFAVVRVG